MATRSHPQRARGTAPQRGSPLYAASPLSTGPLSLSPRKPHTSSPSLTVKSHLQQSLHRPHLSHISENPLRDTTNHPRLDFSWGCLILIFLCAAGEMPSANPATLAQSVERLTRNEQVVSSILTSGSSTLGRFASLGFCILADRRRPDHDQSHDYGLPSNGRHPICSTREWRNW